MGCRYIFVAWFGAGLFDLLPPDNRGQIGHACFSSQLAGGFGRGRDPAVVCYHARFSNRTQSDIVAAVAGHIFFLGF